MPAYSIIKVKLRAVINGGEITFDDVIQFSSVFAMNTIPQASIQVAVGRNVQNNRVATIHSAIANLRTQQKIEIFMRTLVTDKEDAIPGVPEDGEIKIFEGKVVGVGISRTFSSMRFTIHMLHWLADINYTSAISASSHPGNPADITYPAIFGAIGGRDANPNPLPAGDSLEGPAWVPMVSKTLVNESSLEDIWGEILHKWMNTVANDDPFEVALFGGQPGDGNDNTKAALARMGPNPDGRPLNVDLNGANAHVVAEGLRQGLMNETGGNWINTTLWGKLVGEWAPAYWFSVVPRVEDCLIVPFTGGLRGQEWAVLGDEDYEAGDINCSINQVLRAVGILHPTMFFSGIAMNRAQIALDRGGFAGFYQPEGMSKGMVLTKDPPKWLMDPVLPYEFSGCAEGIDGDEIGTTVDETTGDDCDLNRDLEENQRSHRGLMDNYAHQWYVIEMLKGRVGEVAGKLRFDICPGSNVRLEAGGATNVQGDQLKEDVYATVMQVSCVIDAEARRGSTGFSLAHVRTPAENTRDGTSVPKPPLYKDAWQGAKLVSNAQIVQETT